MTKLLVLIFCLAIQGAGQVGPRTGATDVAARARYLGQWSNATSYVLNDVVTFNGYTYICILSNLGVAPPAALYWAGFGGTSNISLGGVFNVNASQPVTSADDKKLFWAYGPSLVITLPPVAPVATWTIWVQNFASTTLTISRNARLINGAAADVTLAQYAYTRVTSDGSNYGVDSFGSGIGGPIPSFPVGSIVGTTDVQTLTNKTLVAPVFTGTSTIPSLVVSGQSSTGTQCAQLTSTGALTGTGTACGTGGVGNAPIASPVFTGTVTTPALIVSGQSSAGTQCAQLTSTGALTGTGTACGAGTTVIAPTGGGSLTVLDVIRVNGNTLTVGANCTFSAPCNVRFGDTTYSFTASSTITLNGGSGFAYVYISNVGVLTVGHTLTLTCTNACNTFAGVTAFPAGSIPLYTWSATSGTWDALGFDQRGFLSIKNNAAGPGIITTEAAGQSSISVDASVVGFRTSVPPSATTACVVGNWAIATGFWYGCVSQNTWQRVVLTSW